MNNLFRVSAQSLRANELKGGNHSVVATLDRVGRTNGRRLVVEITEFEMPRVA